MTAIPLTDKIVRAAIMALGLPLVFIQSALSRRAADRFKPLGELVETDGGYRLHAVVTGKAAPACPTVILEAGMAGCALDWSLVQQKLSAYTKVLSYDRAGFGWSGQPLKRPTCANYVQHLRSLLTELKLTPPYLLVGHSYGGMIMRLFASEYPDEVAGIVLVDSTHEHRYLEARSNGKRKAERAKHRIMYKLGYLLSPIAVPRLAGKPIGSKRLPDGVRSSASALGYRTQAYKAAYLEFLCAMESAVQLSRSHPLRADMPVTVLTAGRQSEEWKEGQHRLLQLSREASQMTVEDSWHSIHIYKPQAVIDAVVHMLSRFV